MTEPKTKVLIGIDPDTDKSGYALYYPGKKTIATLQCFDLIDMMETINLNTAVLDVKVHLEAGWLIGKGNFSDRNKYGSRGANEKIANRVGANNEIGRQLEKFCIRYNIPCMLKKPQGYSSWSHAQFCKYTGWPSKILTNPEKRVAGMMVFGY
jgi:hypothetical protein